MAQSQAEQLVDLAHRFNYHAPDAEKAGRHAVVRQAIHETAVVVTQLTKPSREQSLALTHLEEAMFWANAAIAREQT